jgi:dolichol-phosphate mannosyltransferase
MQNKFVGDLDSGADVGILPATYCEATNIGGLIEQIEHLNLKSKILIVDDSSPDGTADLVKSVQGRYSNIILVVRPKKMGLGTAITDGFKFFLSSKNPPRQIIVMDADYSHDPRDIKTLMSKMSDGVGLVIGSRYCKGGRIQGWPATRWLVSRIANMFARTIAGLRLHDCTSGFRCYSTKFLQASISNLHCTTYEIQIETARQARVKGFGIKETPVLFVNRKLGKSKLSRGEITGFFSYMLRVVFEKAA